MFDGIGEIRTFFWRQGVQKGNGFPRPTRVVVRIQIASVGFLTSLHELRLEFVRFAIHNDVINDGCKIVGVVAASVALLPLDLCDEILFTKDFRAKFAKVIHLVVVDGDENCPVICQEIARQLEARIHHVEPIGMESARGLSVGGKFATSFANLPREFEVVSDVVLKIVLVNEVTAGVIRRVDRNHLNFSGVRFLKQLEHLKVVPLNHKITRFFPIHTFLWARTQRAGAGRKRNLAGLPLAMPVKTIFFIRIGDGLAKQLF